MRGDVALSATVQSVRQNFVANLIAGKHMDPDKAAELWVKANQAKVKRWLG
jgi:ABC-type proline/glycine betaine transport system substrate-binding protein